MDSTHASELKLAGAIEAARDPAQPVTSQDAQKKLVTESRKAGAQAFQFDPNATPEEKAAQARARVPEGFHHERKQHALGIVSDADDGNLGQKYDLPTPTKAGAISGPPSPSQAKATNDDLNQDSRWARDRVGWAPRFGNGDPADDEGATLIEHQTWLDGKLDDKWFGDWYHNAGIMIFACLATHISTILGGGLTGMFIILAFCSTYYRTSLRRVRRNFRDDVRRELAKQSLEHDHEPLEWINNFMLKFWPIYAPVLCDTIISSVDQVLSTTTPAILDSMRMKTFTLGTKPPRMEHVKTYPKTEEDTVLMDWKFSFNPNDLADLTARQRKNRINPKVVLEIRVGKGVVSKGLDVIVEDFAFSGIMRLKFKLQIPFPHVEKIEMCFLGRPTIDYVCKPLGGDMFGFDINVIPGLEGFIQEQIHGNLAPIMYEPNVFPIEIAKMLAGNPVDSAIGVVQLTLHGAEGLRNPDKFPGIPDPYANILINGREILAKTKTIKENANPRWGQTFNVIVTSLTDELHIQLFDWNEFRKDKDLGSAIFQLDRLQGESVHENLHMEVMAGGKARGIVQADIRFFPVLEGEKLADGTASVPESNTGIARFIIEQAKDLDGTKNMTGQLNPYAILLLNGREVHSSKVRKRTNNPIWDDAYKELLITDRQNARLGVVIKDEHEIGGHPIVGTYQVKLNDMIELMAKGQEWYNLAGVKSGRAKMMLQWKPVALKGASGGSGGYVTPIGVMRFHFKNARDLRNLESLGKSDPYVRVLLSGVEKSRTVTFQNNLNPDFDEIVYLPVHNTREKITLEVMDSENTQSDRSLGSFELGAAEYIFQNTDGEYLTHEEKAPQTAVLRIPGREPKGKLNYTVAFYPTYNVQDPEEEVAEKEAKANGGSSPATDPRSTNSRQPSAESIDGVRSARSGTISSLKASDKEMAKELAKNERDQGETKDVQIKEPPKIKLTAEELVKYESGLLVFKLLDADLARSNCYVEILMDDMLFPAHRSSRVRSKQTTFNETGDAIVRELDMSRITVRIIEKIDRKGEGSDEHVYAKLTGQTLDVLRSGLYKTYPLTLKGEDGRANHLTVQLKYLPIKMQLDPSESINNMGTLRVDIHDAADLPAADRNGLSDPYVKFLLNGKQVHKTEVQKKTLHPSWNESFETKISSRTAAHFNLECWDWDRGGSDDHLGSAEINLHLLEPFQSQEIVLGLDGKSGSVRLKMLFKPDYVTRVRQGSSTFHGTFAVPGKVIGAPVKGVGKGAVFVGGNVVRGASFVGGNVVGRFRRKKANGEEEEVTESADDSTANSSVAPSISYPPSAANRAIGADGPPSTPTNGHVRATSSGGASISPSIAGAGVGVGEQGTATFTLLSAQGYDGSNVRVVIKQIGPKGSKEVHKSKTQKMSAEEAATFDEHHETFQVKCTANTQFKVQVKNVHTLGSDDDLGDGLLVVAETPGGASKEVRAGNGTLIFKTAFRPVEAASLLSTTNSPATKSRRSLFGGGSSQRGRERSTTPGE